MQQDSINPAADHSLPNGELTRSEAEVADAEQVTAQPATTLELSDALHEQWLRYRKRLKSCRKKLTETSIHDLRTSTRRLLSTLELCRLILPLPILSSLRKQLKAQLDQFDALRDVQVMLDESSGLLPVLPELADFHQYLQKQEKQLLRDARHFVDDIAAGKQRRNIEKASRRLQKQLQQTDLESSVPLAIDHIYTAAVERYRSLDGDKLETLHALRIAVKKLRYVLEAMPHHITLVDEQRLRDIQSYLAELGEIQNHEVLHRALATFYAGQIPLTLVSYFQQRQSMMVMRFLNRSADVLGFWRA